MQKTVASPRSLVEAVRYFGDPDVANTFLAALRWPSGPACPSCGDMAYSFLKTRRLWKCKGCKRQYSVKVGTIFEDSPIGLDKWLPALWLIANAKNGISSYELARTLGVTQKTGWFMLHRIRLAMQSQSFAKFSGDVEADETYIGGKARNMHKHKRVFKVGPAGKYAVMGLLERHGRDEKASSRVKLQMVPNIRGHRLKGIIKANVEPGSTLYTDALKSYQGLAEEYGHKVIDHAEHYAEGKVHTNGLENFWSLLKRALRGTYVSVEPFHLFRYLDEQVFRFNARKTKDGARFVDTVAGIFGRRLTYKNLIGQGLEPATT